MRDCSAICLIYLFGWCNNDVTKEQISNLLNDQRIINNFKKSLEESIKNSMIPNDHIGILEQIWDKF